MGATAISDLHLPRVSHQEVADRIHAVLFPISDLQQLFSIWKKRETILCWHSAGDYTLILIYLE